MGSQFFNHSQQVIDGYEIQLFTPLDQELNDVGFVNFFIEQVGKEPKISIDDIALSKDDCINVADAILFKALTDIYRLAKSCKSRCDEGDVVMLSLLDSILIRFLNNNTPINEVYCDMLTYKMRVQAMHVEMQINSLASESYDEFANKIDGEDKDDGLPKINIIRF